MEEKITNRSEFLKSIGSKLVVGTLPLYLPSTLKQLTKKQNLEKRIDFENTNPNLEDTHESIVSSELDMIANTQEYIEELRKYAKNTPSREKILFYYEKLKENGIIKNIEDSSERFNIAYDLISPILVIEHGTPYRGANFGLSVESPTGCKGIAQLSFGAFFDVVKWYYEQSKLGKYEDSLLEPFAKSYKRGIYEAYSKKELVLEEILSENSIYDQSRINEIIIKKVQELSNEYAKNYLRSDFNSLFEKEFVEINGKKYNSTALQIEIMAGYLRILNNTLDNWDFTIGAYNHGLGTTRALISRYEGKNLPQTILSEVIEENDLNYRKLYDKRGIEDFLKAYKQNTGLIYLDKEYYTKVLIALYELNSNNV